MKTIHLTGDYMKRNAARAVPGAQWNADAKSWIVNDPDARSAAVALKVFPHLAAEYPWLLELRDETRQNLRPFDQATSYGVEVDAQGVRAQLAKEGKSLYTFQSVDLGYVTAVQKAHGSAYIGWERGLGKTLATCALMDEHDARRTLIVAPNTAKDSVWGVELRRFLPDTEVWVLPNAKSKRERMLQDVAEWGTDAPPLALVVHYEALALIAGKTRQVRSRDKGSKWRTVPPEYELQSDELRRTVLGDGWKHYGEWDLMTVDEGHRLKNEKAQQSKAAKRVPAKHKALLSGSIIENHAEELFSQLQFLFPRNYKAKWNDWNNRYLEYVDGGFGSVYVGVKPDRVEDLRRELGVFMVYRRKDDELDLPGKTVERRLIDIGPKQRKAYNELRDTCITRLDDGTLLKAPDALAQWAKLRQLATGLSLLGAEVSDSTKIDTAVEMILDNEDAPHAVFTWYKAAGHALAAELRKHGLEPFVVDGDVKQATRSELIARFQHGEGRVIIGSIATMGESVNLQRASEGILLDSTTNPALNEQVEDRLYRIGQKNKVTITYLIARDTVDELRVQPLLSQRGELRRAILGG